jgi:hypothetical protein
MPQRAPNRNAVGRRQHECRCGRPPSVPVERPKPAATRRNGPIPRQRWVGGRVGTGAAVGVSPNSDISPRGPRNVSLPGQVAGPCDLVGTL